MISFSSICRTKGEEPRRRVLDGCGAKRAICVQHDPSLAGETLHVADARC